MPGGMERGFPGSLSERWDELVDLNRKGAGIFVTVNETDGLGRKNSNIIRVRAVFQDDDYGFAGGRAAPRRFGGLSPRSLREAGAPHIRAYGGRSCWLGMGSSK